MTAYAPIYAGVTDLPDSYKLCGRKRFTRDSAWWAFNRVADFAAQKWGDMRKDVDEVRIKIEKEGFANQSKIEKKALDLYKENPKEAKEFLTKYTNDYANKIVKTWWDLGDTLWTKYTGKF